MGCHMTPPRKPVHEPITIDGARALPVRSVPAYLVERYHRSFDEEIRRLCRLVDGCQPELDGPPLRDRLHALQLALSRHVIRQEQTSGLFAAAEAGNLLDPLEVETDERDADDLVLALRELAEHAPNRGECACGRALRDGMQLLLDEVGHHLAIERILFARLLL